MEKRE